MADKAYRNHVNQKRNQQPESNKNIPCMKAETLGFAPASIFAEPLTTTAVMGIAPKSPQGNYQFLVQSIHDLQA